MVNLKRFFFFNAFKYSPVQEAARVIHHNQGSAAGEPQLADGSKSVVWPVSSELVTGRGIPYPIRSIFPGTFWKILKKDLDFSFASAKSFHKYLSCEASGSSMFFGQAGHSDSVRILPWRSWYDYTQTRLNTMGLLSLFSYTYFFSRLTSKISWVQRLYWTLYLLTDFGNLLWTNLHVSCGQSRVSSWLLPRAASEPSVGLSQYDHITQIVRTLNFPDWPLNRQTAVDDPNL